MAKIISINKYILFESSAQKNTLKINKFLLEMNMYYFDAFQ